MWKNNLNNFQLARNLIAIDITGKILHFDGRKLFYT